MHQQFPPDQQTIEIDDETTSHTIAAYNSIVGHASAIEIDRECNSDESRDLAVMIYSAPSLTSLSISGSFQDNFVNILKEHAANIQAEKLNLGRIFDLTRGGCSVLAEVVSLMPNLDDLSLQDTCAPLYTDEFFSTLRERAKDLQIRTLEISSSDDDCYWDSAGAVIPSLTFRNDEDLAAALSLMPNLRELTLGLILQKPLFREMLDRASSFENAFPQVARGNFIFNGERQMNMASFRHTLDSYESPERETNWQPRN